MAAGLERCAIGGTKRSAVFVKAHISSRHTSAGIEGDCRFLKPVII